MFVVMRFDQSEIQRPIESCLSAVSVFSDQQEAENEADRLRGLRPDAGFVYFVLLTRHKGEQASDG